VGQHGQLAGLERDVGTPDATGHSYGFHRCAPPSNGERGAGQFSVVGLGAEDSGVRD
jgi:hypothetical protein